MDENKGITGIVCLHPHFNIIGDLTISPNGKIYTIKNPVVSTIIQNSIALIPFPAIGILTKSDDFTIKINKIHILFTYEIDPNLINEYRSKFGSGIVVSGGMPEGILALPGNMADNSETGLA